VKQGQAALARLTARLMEVQDDERRAIARELHDNAAPSEALAGTVERVTFHNAETGFAVLKVKARGKRDLITVVGHAAAISAGEFVNASGVKGALSSPKKRAAEATLGAAPKSLDRA
jgi:hypothetical protein